MTEQLLSAWEAAATTALVFVAWGQIRAAREEAKKERTLAACNRYNSDLVLNRNVNALHRANISGTFDNNPMAFRPKVTNVLNYFESIAIGINQGLYDKQLVCDHLKEILAAYCKEYLNQKTMSALNYKPEDFFHLIHLNDEWHASPLTLSEDDYAQRSRVATLLMAKNPDAKK